MFRQSGRLLVYRWKHFRVHENVGDALRNTILVLLPLLTLYSRYQEAAVGMAVGTLVISLTDLPGNRRDKTLTALQSLAINLVTAVVFSLSLSSPLTTGITLVVLTFVLSMFAALGGRSTGAGSMGIALMVFMLGLQPAHPLQFSFYIFLGGTWFYLISLAQVYLWPFRSLHQALREVLAATADFLEAKATCYDPGVPLAESYKRTIVLHLRVAEKQEVVRQILLGDDLAMRAADDAYVKSLLNTAIQAIRLYEQVTATHYDYVEVHERLQKSGALDLAAQLIRLQATETRWLSRVVPLSKLLDTPGGTDSYNTLVKRLTMLASQLPNADATVINGLLVNAEAIRSLLEGIRIKRDDALPQLDTGRPESANLSIFLSGAGSYRARILSQLHWRSPVLRFALRLTLMFAVGYLATVLVVKDPYTYWLLLTILIVSRPRLAVTWQRNLERLAGTLVGVALASLILFIISSPAILLSIAVLALFGFFTWNRYRYSWCVCCVTVSVVLCLSVYHGGPVMILSARIGYTLAGCALAFAGIFIFPVWIRSELDGLTRAAVEGNKLFLLAVVNEEAQAKVWLARKEAHLRLARLSEGIRHARVEPDAVDLPRLEQIQVLNYRINSVIISLFLSPRRAGLKRSSATLQRIYQYLDAYINGLPSEITATINKNEELLKGIALLEALTAELAAYANNKPQLA
jgi:uncharacterized membrane protein YccC